MLRLALVALVVTSACRLSLEDKGGDDSPPDDGGRLCKVVDSDACNAATSNQSLNWIEQNIFTTNCGSSSCHGNVALPGGRVVLTTGSHAKLVGIDAEFAPGRKLVVAGSVKESYLMVLLRHITPGEAEPSPAPAPPDLGNDVLGYMPLNSPPICCQKMDSIVRWIEAGALNN